MLRHGSATRRQHRDQCGDRIALSRAPLVFRVQKDQNGESSSSKPMQESRVAWREQPNQHLHAPHVTDDAFVQGVAVQTLLPERPSRLVIHAGRAARRKQCHQRRYATARAHGIAASRISPAAHVGKRGSSLTMHRSRLQGFRAGRRQQPHQGGDAAALAQAVSVMRADAHAVQRQSSQLVHASRAAWREQPDQRRHAPARSKDVPVALDSGSAARRRLGFAHACQLLGSLHLPSGRVAGR